MEDFGSSSECLYLDPIDKLRLTEREARFCSFFACS